MQFMIPLWATLVAMRTYLKDRPADFSESSLVASWGAAFSMCRWNPAAKEEIVTPVSVSVECAVSEFIELQIYTMEFAGVKFIVKILLLSEFSFNHF
jgi:hypothetical protein